MSIPNYTFYQINRPSLDDDNKTVGGGVAIAIKAHLKHSLLPSFNTSVIEALGIEIYGMRTRTQIVAVYFPGSKITVTKLELFKRDLKILTSLKSSFIICGDLNAHHRFWNCVRANRAGKILYGEMSTGNFLVHYPPNPTHYPTQSRSVTPSTIDIALSAGISGISNLSTHSCLASDHLPVTFEVNFSSLHLGPTPVRWYAKANWDNFKTKIHEDIDLVIASRTIIDKSSIDQAINNLSDIIENSQKSCIPMRNFSSKKQNLPSEIKQIISIRNCVRRRWQRSRSDGHRLELNNLNKEIQDKISILRGKEFQDKLANFKNNSKQLWSVTKLLKNGFTKLPALKGKNGQHLITDQEKVNEIGNTFCDAHKITHVNKSDSRTESAVNSSISYLTFLTPKIDSIKLVKPIEIIKIIIKLNGRKSPGDDGINNILIKHLPKRAIVLLTYIFNACLKIGYFPDSWKCAKVIPIPKPGKDLSSSKNYRPISLLSSISKIFEKIILSRLSAHMGTKSLILNEQFGFRHGHSTNHQLLRLSQHIKSGFAGGKSTGVITFDIEKAFDSVWHNGLLHKMFSIKYPLYLIKLIRSYLKSRSFFVSINGTKSTTFSILAGVPQGSVLGPTLYNIFTSDLKVPIKECQTALFADDTAFYATAKNPDKIVRILNESAQCLSEYCLKWKIKLNDTKTQAVFFTKRRSQQWLPAVELTVQNSPIPWSNQIKYLGVTLDKKLTFGIHIDLAVQKAQKYIAILYTLIGRKSRLNTFNKLILFKNFFQSILLFACPVWGRCAQIHKNKLQIIQNRCLKIILRLPNYFPTELLHKIAKVNKIDRQITKIETKFANKLLNSGNPLIRQLSTF